jgi:hypothetical protein
MWIARFGRDFGPVVRQTAKWMIIGNTRVLFDCVLCPVAAFQRCSRASCASFRQAIVAAAERYERADFRKDYSCAFFVTQWKPDDERKDCLCSSRIRCPIFLWRKSEQKPRGDEIMRSACVLWRRRLFATDGATIYIPVAYITKYIVQEAP